MGTASSMACMVEALGLSLPGNAAIPAADSNRKVLAQQTGKRIVDMVKEDLKPSDILTRKAFENAIKVNAAVGGSTNFVIHLLAIAGRVGVPLELEDFDVHSRNVPLIANLQPSGQFFMEDLYYAGGLPAVMQQISDRLHTDAVTANGKPVSDNIRSAQSWDTNVIATAAAPVNPLSGIVVLRGTSARTAPSSSHQPPRLRSCSIRAAR